MFFWHSCYNNCHAKWLKYQPTNWSMSSDSGTKAFTMANQVKCVSYISVLHCNYSTKLVLWSWSCDSPLRSINCCLHTYRNHWPHWPSFGQTLKSFGLQLYLQHFEFYNAAGHAFYFISRKGFILNVITLNCSVVVSVACFIRRCMLFFFFFLFILNPSFWFPFVSHSVSQSVYEDCNGCKRK